MYDKDKDFYPNDTGWLGYGNVSVLFVLYLQHHLILPYNQDYWRTLYLVVYSINAIDGISNWQF